MTKNLLLFITISVLAFSSCSFPMRLTTNLPNACIVYNNHEYPDTAIVEVSSSNKNLQVLVRNDSVSKEFTVRSNPHRPAYHFDYTDTSFIAVSKRVATTGKDQIRLSGPKPPFVTKKGQLNLIIPMLSYTDMTFHPEGEPYVNRGSFLSLDGGLEYFYSDMKSLQLRVITAMASSTYTPYYNEGDHESVHTLNVSLTDNIRLKRFMLGYGVNVAINQWFYHWDEVSDFDQDFGLYEPAPYNPWKLLPPTKERKNVNLGASLNASYALSRNFLLGITYQPSIYRLNLRPGFIYERALSLDLSLRVKVF